MAKNKYHVRKFLNKKQGTATLEISAEYTAWNFNCDVALSDCNRKVNLDFSMWEDKYVKERMDKLDLLINELTALRTYLIPATADFITLNKASKAKQNKGKSTGIIETLGLTTGDLND
jgi:hypothetical protein